MSAPNFTIYLQALGGKFLGPNAYNTNNISIVLSYSGGVVSFHYNLSNNPHDGAINTSFTAAATSPSPILTAQATGNPDVNYLTPGSDTICAVGFVATKAAYETATLTITIPTSNGKSLVFTEAVVLSSLQTSYRLIIPIPGLLLLPGQNACNSNNLSVFVKMMCGCGITTGLKNSFWSPGDFSVQADVIYTDITSESFPMSFDPVTNDSLFFVIVPNSENIFHVTFTAQQQSTSNYGYLIQAL